MILARGVTKVYGSGAAARTALDDVSLAIGASQIAAIVGPSGAGKSTLARCFNLLDRPTAGSIVIDGQELSGLREKDLAAARRRIGTIFQGSSLLRRRTAIQNVELPLEMAGVGRAERRARAAELLDRVGLEGRAASYPQELSGGQKQRVGIARALALAPRILLSDEGTTGLDNHTRAAILELLLDLRSELGLTIVLITHEMEVVREIADTAFLIRDGRIIERGDVRRLVLDAHSLAGRWMFPPRPFAEAGALGEPVYRISYAQTGVTGDWIVQLSQRVNAPIRLLGASVERMQAAAVGYVIVATAAPATALAAAANQLGLAVTPYSNADVDSLDALEAAAADPHPKEAGHGR